ncbi:hypothetical protein D3C71_1484830 [compost metagenome]
MAAQHCVHRHEHRWVRRGRPGLAVIAQRAPLLLQCRVARCAREALKHIPCAWGDFIAQWCERGAHGVGCRTKVGVADGRGIDTALALYVDQLPPGEAVQITAGGVLEVAHQADPCRASRHPCHTFAHGFHPDRFVVVVAHGQHRHTAAIGL